METSYFKWSLDWTLSCWCLIRTWTDFGHLASATESACYWYKSRKITGKKRQSGGLWLNWRESMGCWLVSFWASRCVSGHSVIFHGPGVWVLSLSDRNWEFTNVMVWWDCLVVLIVEQDFEVLYTEPGDGYLGVLHLRLYGNLLKKSQLPLLSRSPNSVHVAEMRVSVTRSRRIRNRKRWCRIWDWCRSSVPIRGLCGWCNSVQIIWCWLRVGKMVMSTSGVFYQKDPPSRTGMESRTRSPCTPLDYELHTEVSASPICVVLALSVELGCIRVWSLLRMLSCVYVF